eukprot:CAMPEP_0184493342 /NCGR_PEP_ID=MMETSP0113_2-20130426/25741_1 /TAXON_ID=91329 /ORGANISM="Norrisiella sphaerica, Strain BC52" /LENGTH=880 /DNA_ID=CAMNT_0026878565 /DNA_START=152 /DNA_END=2794 /DNA_ORIENTATION=+
MTTCCRKRCHPLERPRHEIQLEFQNRQSWPSGLCITAMFIMITLFTGQQLHHGQNEGELGSTPHRIRNVHSVHDKDLVYNHRSENPYSFLKTPPFSWLSVQMKRWFPALGRSNSQQHMNTRTDARKPGNSRSDITPRGGKGLPKLPRSFVSENADRAWRILVETNKRIGSFARAKRWREALSTFHELTGEDGVPGPDVISFNNLLTAYAKAALWSRAIKCLGGMRDVTPDIIIYNSVINACARSGKWRQALEVFKEVLESELQPDSATFSSLINSLTRGEQWEAALRIGDFAKRAVPKLNAVVYTALINAASRGRQWSRAVQTLETMVRENLRLDSIAYSSLIASCGDNVEQARAICTKLEKLGLRRDTSAFNALIGVYAKSHQWSEAMANFEQMKRGGVRLNIFTYNTVIAMQTADKNSEGAEWLFKEMQRDHIRADVIAYNLRINALAQRGQRERALAVVQEMNNAGLRSNRYTYDFLITACEQAEQFDEGVQTFNAMINSGVRMDVVSFTKHIKFQKERGDWRAALRTFSHMLQSSVRANDVSYRTLISVCSIIPQGAANAATAVFLEMQMSELRADVTAYNTLISACAAEHWTRALRAFRSMQIDDVAPNVVTYNALLSAFEKGAELGMCRRLFRSMNVRKDTLTYAAYINCAGRAGRWQLALDTFEGMRKEGLRADTQLYNTLITAISRSSKWQRAVNVLEEMKKQKVSQDTKTCIAVMRACDQAQEYQAAIDTYEACPERFRQDSSIAELLVNAQCALGRWEETLQTLERMPRNSQLYSLVLSNFATQSHLHDRCLSLFNEMRSKKVKIQLDAYNSVMRIWAEKGKWNQALEIFDSMLQTNVQPDSHTYDILIAAYTKRRTETDASNSTKNFPQ